MACATILDGKRRAQEIREALKREVASFDSAPRLIALQVNDDTAFSVYAEAQKRMAEDLGIEYELLTLAKNATEKDLVQTIQSLNDNKGVNGIIVQSPLPQEFDFFKIASFISPLKDVEGLHPEHNGKMLLGQCGIIPPTAAAVMDLIHLSGVDLYGKEVVIIGHSRIVGKPLALLLLNEFATVTVCHIATSEKGDLVGHIKRAEVLIVAVGKAGLVKGAWLKKGAVVIDVGINRCNGKIWGDVEFEAAKKKASYITPVPGGVGPLTTAILMQNCVTLFKRQRKSL